MQAVIKDYDTKIDSKKRIVLRNAKYEYYHVNHFEDGRILLEPRELTAPFQVSEKTLTMMDQSMKNMKEGQVSDIIDLSEFEVNNV